MKNQRKEKRRDLSRQVRDMYIDHGVELVTQKAANTYMEHYTCWRFVLCCDIGCLFRDGL